MSDNSGAAAPYKARKFRAAGKGLGTKLKAASGVVSKINPGRSFQPVTKLGPTRGQTPLPLPLRKMPMKQTQPVPPIPGQKLPSGKIKMYSGRKKQTTAKANPYTSKGRSY